MDCTGKRFRNFDIYIILNSIRYNTCVRMERALYLCENIGFNFRDLPAKLCALLSGDINRRTQCEYITFFANYDEITLKPLVVPIRV